MIEIGGGWDALLENEFKKEYYIKLREFLKNEYKSRRVYPDMFDIFNALKNTPYDKIKMVILGQDPYHGEEQAHGLCFSVKKGVALPPSLVNIFKEIKNELGIEPPSSGELSGWARQGVLLLNTVLTVRAGYANSHKGIGWEFFTDSIISLVNNLKMPVVFLLWGANARSKTSLLNNPSHLILSCSHPSPLSAHNGFFGCGHFKSANEFLVKNGITPVDWKIYD